MASGDTYYTFIKQPFPDGVHETTHSISVAPTFCEEGADQILSWLSRNNNKIYISIWNSFDGLSAPALVKDLSEGVSDPRSHHGPAIAVLPKSSNEGLLVITYKDKDSGNIGYTTATLNTEQSWTINDWSPSQLICDVSEIKPRSSTGPAMVVYGDSVYMFYRGHDNQDVYLSIFDGETWSGDKSIHDLSDGKVTAITDKTPSAIVYNDKIYFSWRNPDHEGAIYLAAYDVESGEWTGEASINTLSEGKIDPETASSPYLASSGNILRIYYRGMYDVLVKVEFDGKQWSGDVIKDINGGLQNPQTIVTPCAFIESDTTGKTVCSFVLIASGSIGWKNDIVMAVGDCLSTT